MLSFFSSAKDSYGFDTQPIVHLCEEERTSSKVLARTCVVNIYACAFEKNKILFECDGQLSCSMAKAVAHMASIW